MSWEDRLREAAYTGATSGERLTFDYEDVAVEFDKQASAFNFVDANGTYIQDRGKTGRRCPLRVIFWGEDYDLDANRFLGMLSETGAGKLEHPAYGVVNVVPFGKIRRRDDLKTAANQAIIEVVFWETLGAIFPQPQGNPAAEVAEAVEEYNATASEALAEDSTLDEPLAAATATGQYKALLDSATKALKAIADGNKAVSRKFNSIRKSINASLNVLMREPLTLAAQSLRLLQVPSEIATGVTSQLNTYRSQLNLLIGTTPSNANSFYLNELYASGFVTSSVLASVAGQFETKADALQAAEEIISQLDDLTVWRESNIEALGNVDTGGAYQQLQRSVALAAGALVQISFALKEERSLVLDRAKTIIELEAELYGTVDTNLDFLIAGNSLTGDEILTVPAGREILYYA